MEAGMIRRTIRPAGLALVLSLAPSDEVNR